MRAIRGLGRGVVDVGLVFSPVLHHDVSQEDRETTRLEDADGGVVGSGAFTLRSEIDSSLWRGTIVTISISQRKATSVGTRPGGKGRAIFVVQLRNPWVHEAGKRRDGEGDQVTLIESPEGSCGGAELWLTGSW